MRFTLITPTLNAERYLPEALESLAVQSWPDVEHIVVDGGSTDRTLALVQASRPARVISEPDRGLYEAINKGIDLASGDLIGLLNADDRLEPGALESIAAAFVLTPGAEMVSGGAEAFESSGSETRTLWRLNDEASKRLGERHVIHNAAMINARFFRPALLRRLGGFDARWPRCPDHDLLLRVVHLDPVRVAAAQVVYRYRFHSGSLTYRAGVEKELTEEQLDLCTTRMSETRRADERLYRRYQRWHSWNAAYLASRHLRERDASAAASDFGRGLRANPMLPLLVPVQAVQHLRLRSMHR